MDLNQMNADDLESALNLLADLKDVTNADHLTLEGRLATIHEAITRGIGGTLEEAREFVRDVLVGLLEPPF